MDERIDLWENLVIFELKTLAPDQGQVDAELAHLQRDLEQMEF